LRALPQKLQITIFKKEKKMAVKLFAKMFFITCFVLVAVGAKYLPQDYSAPAAKGVYDETKLAQFAANSLTISSQAEPDDDEQNSLSEGAFIEEVAAVDEELGEDDRYHTEPASDQARDNTTIKTTACGLQLNLNICIPLYTYF
jgi:hypothetical protein